MRVEHAGQGETGEVRIALERGGLRELDVELRTALGTELEDLAGLEGPVQACVLDVRLPPGPAVHVRPHLPDLFRAHALEAHAMGLLPHGDRSIRLPWS